MARIVWNSNLEFQLIFSLFLISKKKFNYLTVTTCHILHIVPVTSYKNIKNCKRLPALCLVVPCLFQMYFFPLTLFFMCQYLKRLNKQNSGLVYLDTMKNIRQSVKCIKFYRQWVGLEK